MADNFDDHVRCHDSKQIAAEIGDHAISYGELQHLAEGIAHRLLLIGFQPGDVLGLRLTRALNTPLHMAIMWGAARVGCILFSIAEHLSPIEVSEIARDIDLRGVVVDDSQHGVPTTSSVLVSELIAPIPPATPPPNWPTVSPDAPLLMNQSSGTTGSSKLFVFSHADFIDTATQYRSLYDWTAHERLFFNVSMDDTWGREMCLTSLFVGSTIVVAHAQATTDIIAAINQQRITMFPITPLGIRQLLAEPTDPRSITFPDVRFVMCSSAVLQADEHSEFARRFTPHTFNGYGTTEVPHISMLGSDELSRKPGSVGTVYPGVQVQIVDEGDSPVGSGVIGKLRVRTPHMLREYFRNESATQRFFKDGWFYPMDLAYVDDDGYIFLQGRVTDVFDDFVPQVRNDVVATERGDELVVRSPAAGGAVALDPIKAAVFQLIDGKVTIGELNADLCAVLGVTEVVARDLLRRTMAMLEHGAILTTSVGGTGASDRSDSEA